MAHLRKAVSYVHYLVPLVPDDAYYVLHLAAARDVRGRGVGARLLAAAFDRARRNGSCLPARRRERQSAVRFYGRMGMEILSESRVLPLEKHGIASHYRMVKNL